MSRKMALFMVVLSATGMVLGVLIFGMSFLHEFTQAMRTAGLERLVNPWRLTAVIVVYLAMREMSQAIDELVL